MMLDLWKKKKYPEVKNIKVILKNIQKQLFYIQNMFYKMFTEKQNIFITF